MSLISVAESSEELAVIAALLHDARIIKEDAHFSVEPGEFRLPAWVPAWEQASSRRILCCLYWRNAPWKRMDLIVSDVAECRIMVQDGSYSSTDGCYAARYFRCYAVLQRRQVPGPCPAVRIVTELPELGVARRGRRLDRRKL